MLTAIYREQPFERRTFFMALRLIKGGQRAGKSYYCTNCIKIDLADRKSRRPIYTNLPINPDRISDDIAKTPMDAIKILKQIYLFIPYDKVTLRKFRKTNPLFYSEFRGQKKKNKYYERDVVLYQRYKDDLAYNEDCKFKKDHKELFPVDRPQRITRTNCHLLNEKHVKQFWNFTQRGAVIYIDEAYEHFGNANYKKAEMADTRAVMHSYMRQHGHQEHDMFLISHRTTDFDTIIRGAVMETIHVVNAKYENIFSPDSKLGSLFPLKFPWQFFVVRKYRDFYDGNAELNNFKGASSKEFLLPTKRGFELYTSLSDSSVLGAVTSTDPDFDYKSSDTEELSVRKNVFKAFKEMRSIIIFFLLLIGGGFYLISTYLNVMEGLKPENGMTAKEYETYRLKEKKGTKEDAAHVVQDDKKVLNKKLLVDPKEKKVPVKQEKREITKRRIVYKTNNKIIFDDGLELIKGTSIDGHKINKFGKSGFVSDSNILVLYRYL